MTSTHTSPATQPADELPALRAQVAALRTAVLGYRWQQLAADLVLAYRIRRTRQHTTRTLEHVVHRNDCKRRPDGRTGPVRLSPTGGAVSVDAGADYGRADGTYWQVVDATGVSLRVAMTEQLARACKVCRPNVDPSHGLDGAGTLPVYYLRTTREQHEPQLDGGYCPNPGDCARYGHTGGLVEGDVCECCGEQIGAGL